MSRSLTSPIVGAWFLVALAASVGARERAPELRTLFTIEEHLPMAQQRLLYDPPAAHLEPTGRAAVDTLWFGGVDAGGVAVPGGVWDFDDGTLQGWTSQDLTDEGVHVRHVADDSCAAHGDPVCPVINGEGSLWIGLHEDEAQARCWPGGMGYGNNWGQNVRKTFNYSGSGSVTLSFDYFVDIETQFDFVYVYTEVDGVRSTPLNSSAWSTPEGWGYSGGVAEGTGIGSPDDPAHDEIVIDVSDLPPGEGPVDIVFSFQSDLLYSDELGSFFDSIYGAFGVDDVTVQGVGLSDLSSFETGLDGWTGDADDPVGPLMGVYSLDELDPIDADECLCPLEGHVLIAADASGLGFPHPEGQKERLESPAAYVGPGSGVEGTNGRLIKWDVWEDTPLSNGVGYAVGFSYYPWTCPTTGSVGWTTQPTMSSVFFSETPRCGSFLEDQQDLLPADVDSLRLSFLVIGDCDTFGIAECSGPEETNQTPYFDNIRIGAALDPIDAPPLSVDLLYQDVFPADNSLLPTATADVHSFYDNNRADGDFTNANMGDSVVVLAGTDPDTEVYLNFRVYPGPGMGAGHPFLTDPRHGGSALAPSWARARMDTAEVSTGVRFGQYSSYYWPDGQETLATDKIIPDDVLTPGTTVEYFFSAAYSSSADERVQPDTTGGFYLEFEVLPGYFEVDGDVLSPCYLYVDAFNAGAQLPIEEHGLGPYLGHVTDDDELVHAAWDRYDYLAASSNVPAPMAREMNGDNGMTKFQSLIYRHMLYNTGTLGQEGLRNGDADLLATWLTTDDLDRWTFEKSLWLSGDGIATILDQITRPASQALLADLVGAAFVGYYGDLSGDASACVRLDAALGADFPGSTDSYAAVGSAGCPATLDFQVVAPIGDGAGNLVYVNQDDGEVETPYASVSNEQIPGGTPSNPENYRVVLDAFSLDRLRSVPDGWTGEDCGDDPAAITRRFVDVSVWAGVPTGPCETPVVDVPDGAGGGAPALTRLQRSVPNPFNPRTTIHYDLGDPARVELRIFDVSGRAVRTLVDQDQAPAHYTIAWDGRDDAGTEVASGVYWARMSTSTGFRDATKLVVLK
jgi:hypothetical protein